MDLTKCLEDTPSVQSPRFTYSRLTGFDALLIDRMVYNKFREILLFLCTRKYPEVSSLNHVVFMQK